VSLDGEMSYGNYVYSWYPKLRPAQPSGGAWREATVRNRKRVAQALRAIQDFTGVINNALGITYNLRFRRRIDEPKKIGS